MNIPKKNLEIPLLLELAVCDDGKIEVVKRGRSDLDDIVERLDAMYQLSDEEKREVVKDGRGKFKNMVQWAQKELREKGEVDHVELESYAVNIKGMQRLRDFVAPQLKRLPSARLTAFYSERDENNQELLLSALRRVPEESLVRILHECETQQELFVAAVRNIPAKDFDGFAVSAFEEIRDLIIEYHIAPVRE